MSLPPHCRGVALQQELLHVPGQHLQGHPLFRDLPILLLFSIYYECNFDLSNLLSITALSAQTTKFSIVCNKSLQLKSFLISTFKTNTIEIIFML